MQYPFTMYGRIIQIHRYKVEYTETMPWPDEYGGPVEEPRTEYCNTQEQAAAVAADHEGSTVAELDSAAYEWLDGIEVADVPDTYAEAVMLYEMGQAAYEQERDKPTPEEIIASQGEQITDLQMALCDMYEAMEVMKS